MTPADTPPVGHDHPTGLTMPPLSPMALGITAFIFSACIGSFLNVVIHRLPAGQSLSRPGSHCPRCQAPVKWYDNIPILSYAILRARCRHCRGSIHWRYPLVEFITGILGAAVFLVFGQSWIALIYFAFTAVLIAVSFIDIDHRIIPDRITYPGIPIAIVCGGWFGELSPSGAILGALVGGGFLYLVSWLYFKVKQQQGIGMGDVKLMAMVGGLLGWKGVLFTIFFGSAAGTTIGIAYMVIQGQLDAKMKIPFGPFLSFGAILFLFVGNEFFTWYASLLVIR